MCKYKIGVRKIVSTDWGTYTSPPSITTQKKIQTTRIREEIRFLYKKKDKVNETLYKTHLLAAWEWGKGGAQSVLNILRTPILYLHITPF